MPQVVVRLPAEEAAALDALVASGAAETRSHAVRTGLRLLLDRHRRDTTGAAIVSGYVRTPQRDDDGAWTDEQTRAMIADEPW